MNVCKCNGPGVSLSHICATHLCPHTSKLVPKWRNAHHQILKPISWKAYLCKWCQIWCPNMHLVFVLTLIAFEAFHWKRGDDGSHFILLFQIKTKLIYHVFLTILHKSCKILFAALNSKELDSSWYLILDVLIPLQLTQLNWDIGAEVTSTASRRWKTEKKVLQKHK